MTDKIISTTKTKAMAKILGTDADTAQKAYQSELESSEGIDTISEQLEKNGLTFIRDDANMLKEVILVRDKLFILELRFSPQTQRCR